MQQTIFDIFKIETVKPEPILVSSCLLGQPCRWHGRPCPISRRIRQLLFRAESGEVVIVSVCPELLGGLGVPRPPVKRRGGRILQTCAEKSQRKNTTGKDVTAEFEAGARQTLDIAIKRGCKKAILCKYSPSCDKQGFTGKLLTKAGIEIENIF